VEHPSVGVGISIIESSDVVSLFGQGLGEDFGRLPSNGLFGGTDFGRSGRGWDLG
jgi:hypothetical protein